MSFGWEGELTRLVPLDKEKHLKNGTAWLNDPVVTAWLLVGDLPVTSVNEEAFFDRVSQPGGTDILLAVETLEGQHIGFSGAHRIDWRNGNAVTGSFIGRPDFWGKRYGSDAARVRSEYLFETVGLRMLYSEVLSGNDRSLAMLKRVGYREVGRLPERYWKRGAWRDAILLALDAGSWRSARGGQPGP